MTDSRLVALWGDVIKEMSHVESAKRAYGKAIRETLRDGDVVTAWNFGHPLPPSFLEGYYRAHYKCREARHIGIETDDEIVEIDPANVRAINDFELI